MEKTKAEPKQSDRPELKLALQREFVNRCKKNPAYSMRAFAKFLDIDQSFLSKMMRGQRSISQSTSLSLYGKLGLKPSQFIIDESSSKKDPFLPLIDDEFLTISDWYHFAILELAKTNNFNPKASAMARRLGIHVEEVRAAIERLRRLGLVRIEDGKFSLNSASNSWTNTQTTSDAKRLLQKQLLEKGIQAIETVPFADRENGSLTVAIDKKRLPEFKEKLAKIRKELSEYFQDSDDLNEVYQLTLSFYPLTKTPGDLT
jgi:plasmid maintenance system antidote protein VapI